VRLAIFGGTFDPIHSGHLEAVISAVNARALDRVLVVPSGVPPHKPEACRAAYAHRFRMVELACAADSRLAASRLEEPRLDGKPHYSVDTIERVRSAFAFEPPLRFVIGADAFAEVDLWRDAASVAASVEFLVVGRPGCELPRLGDTVATRRIFVPCAHPASSRIMRHRVKIGGTLADLAPPAVCEYIWEHGLYRF
jgi:nicotinate-nucleotide adenylyltransferase